MRTDAVDLADKEVRLVLAGLFELTVTYLEDDEKRQRCKPLVAKLDRDAHAVSYGATAPGR